MRLVLPAVFWAALTVTAVEVRAEPLAIATVTEVSADGKVDIALVLKNRSSGPLHHLHPMFHFHHSMVHMAMIHRLDPGESVRLVNHQHPPVRREGTYPVVAMVNYRLEENSPDTVTQVHTDRFAFGERLDASIEGNIRSTVRKDDSRVVVQLRNTSPAFKNVRLMLLLPPELAAESFQGMMGFTLHGGEEKQFEVPVKKVGGRPGGIYPVHLMVEYGEMLKHYSSDIRGSIDFGPVIGRGAFWPQYLVYLFVSVTLLMLLHRRWKLRHLPT